MALESILNSYVTQRGLPKVNVLGVHQYTLSLEAFTVHVGYFEERGMLMLHAGIALIPSQEKQSLYAKLLQANTMFSETDGMTLGIDPDEHIVTLQLAWPMHALDNEGFHVIFDNFVFLAAAWMQKLAPGIPAAPSSPIPPENISGTMTPGSMV